MIRQGLVIQALGVALATAWLGACGGEDGGGADTQPDAVADTVGDTGGDTGGQDTADAAAELPDAGPDVSSDGGADVAPDQQPSVDVVFSELRAEEITEQGALIRFQTNVAVLGSVEYGEAGAGLDSVAVDPGLDPTTKVTDHAIPLTGLSADTDWSVRARATDALGVLHVSQTLAFATPEPTAPPVTGNVALASNGAKVSAVSSNFGGTSNSSSKGANKAIDGDLETLWASDGDGKDAFIELDLGADRTVAKVAFASFALGPSDAPQGQIKSLRVLFDGVESALGTVELPEVDQLYEFDLPAAVTVRHVRVEAVDALDGNTGLREVQLFTP
ncbi:MAG: discoidin domain-containing protein [Deltaproteobacteria bacterium]|nr:discoidin domain-containing protein [Deltaproteobacteria bacterium]